MAKLGESKKTGVDRRSLVSGLPIGAALLATPWLSRSAAAQAGQLTIPSYGGSFQEGLVRAIFAPFTKETGIKIVFSGVPDLARAKAQVTSGSVEWDVMQATGAWGPAGEKQNLWEKVDTDVVDMSRNIKRDSAYYLTSRFSVGGLSWDPTRSKAAPQDFAEFWDLKTFPGRRTLQNRIDYVLDTALVADGVDPKALYPLDVERGFRALDRIKPAIVKWADTATQLGQLLQTGEVEFAWNYINRVVAANRAGIKQSFSKKQLRLSGEHWCVLRGTKNKAAAMKFLAFTNREDVQVALVNELTTVPGIPIANSRYAEEIRDWIPDPTDPKYIIQDDVWWAAELEPLQRRFKEWLLT